MRHDCEGLNYYYDLRLLWDASPGGLGGIRFDRVPARVEPVDRLTFENQPLESKMTRGVFLCL